MQRLKEELRAADPPISDPQCKQEGGRRKHLAGRI
jgi:hypothetical protein